MKNFFKLVLCLVLCNVAYADDDPNYPPCPGDIDVVNSCNWTPNCDFPQPPPPEGGCGSLPIDDYILPMLLVSIGLGYYAVQYKTKKTPS